MSGFTNNETRRTPNLLHQTKNARTKPMDRLTWGVPAGVHSRGGVRRRVRCAVEPGSAYKADSWPHASPLLPVSPRARRGPAGRREQQKEAQADDSLASSARIVACAFANSSAVAASANLSSAASAAPALAGSLEGSPAAARHSDDGSLLLLTSVLSAGGAPPPPPPPPPATLRSGGAATSPRSCRPPRRTAGAGGRGSPRTSPSSRGRWPRGRSSPCHGRRLGWSRAAASASPRRR
mmetsp:Transcript_7226/g.23177  ORF Transcript_7226/g.23177 Transcript_7226/m.23177 type:complete len:237 (+) Transcript_7226:111-821(+)